MNDPKKRVRLMLDFVDAEDAADFVRTISNALPEPVGAFQCDALDFNVQSGGIGRKNTYIMLPPRLADDRKRLSITRVEDV